MTFDLQAKWFSLNNARRGAEFCAMTYSVVEPNNAWTPNGNPVWRVLYDSPTDTLALLQKTDGAIVLAFRGSKSIENWVTDFDAFRANASGIGWAHAGFYHAAQSILQPVLTHIKTLDAASLAPLPLVITGHSLGGSLALIAAWLINIALPGRIHSIYALEAAKVGGAGFKAAFNTALGDKTFCVTNAADLVPWLPEGFGYERVGHELFFPDPAYSLAPLIDPSTLTKLWSDKMQFLTEFLRLRTSKWLGVLNPCDSPLLADHPIGAVIRRLAVGT